MNTTLILAIVATATITATVSVSITTHNAEAQYTGPTPNQKIHCFEIAYETYWNKTSPSREAYKERQAKAQESGTSKEDWYFQELFVQIRILAELQYYLAIYDAWHCPEAQITLG